MNLIVSNFLVYLVHMLLVSWGFLVVMKTLENNSQQSLTVTYMNESKDILMEMQDQYKRFLSTMLQRYTCVLLLIVEPLRKISTT